MFFYGYLVWKSNITKIHRLTTPLQLSTEQASNGMLPVGTSLYYDTSFPEGFSRYKIYVNIDRMPLELETLQDPTMIDPVEATAFSQDAVVNRLRNHPFTKDELRAIINSGYLSKDDIKEVLSEFTDGK
ncbi:transmembrane protein [Herbaspirillum seropedicae]|nr:transmembrane protein [Herbaspirillum seropedicae]